MIDLHCHIIPYIDDGANNIKIACEMAKYAWKSGVDTIVATPHCNLRSVRPNYRDQEYTLIFSMFRALLKQHGIPIKILPGAEVFAHDDNIRELIENRRLVTINHSRYLLVEFAFHLNGKSISRTLDAIARRGLIPIIAHPERYDAVQENPYYASRWFEQGFVIQLNKGSLLGRLGYRAQKCATELLSNGFAHVLASDAHDMKYRPPGFRSLTETFQIDPDYLKLLLETNPRRIISDQLLLHPKEDIFDAEEEY